MIFPRLPIRREKSDEDAWLVTLADLLALLLTFFVMLFSMNAVQEKEWKAVVASLNEHFHGEVPAVKEAPEIFNEQFMSDLGTGQDLAYLFSILELKLSEDAVFDQARLRTDGDRITLSLPGELIFPSGSARISVGARATLFRLAAVIDQIENTVVIEGHTDPAPVRSGRFVTNWELSLARAVSVANALREAGFSRSIPVLGFGAARYAETPSNLSDRERRMAARRVDVVIHRHKWEDPLS